MNFYPDPLGVAWSHLIFQKSDRCPVRKHASWGHRFRQPIMAGEKGMGFWDSKKKSQDKTHAYYIGISKSLLHSSFGFPEFRTPYKSTTFNKRYLSPFHPTELTSPTSKALSAPAQPASEDVRTGPGVQLDHQWYPTNIWVFPKIVGFFPPNHLLKNRVFAWFSPSILGVLPLFLGSTPI